jgi:Ca2+-binding EF-hand superfamily protein
MPEAPPTMRIISFIAFTFVTALAIPAANPAAPNQIEDRAAALKKYDRDGDARLADSEREAMRKEVFEQRRSAMGKGRRRMPFPPPPEIIKKYDKDGDGELDDDESQAAQVGIQKMFRDLHVKYDANGNGDLEPDEFEKILADKAAGKLEDVPQMFLQMGRRGRSATGGRPSPVEVAKQMDRNRDGRLDEEELEAARHELEKLRSAKRDDGGTH